MSEPALRPDERTSSPPPGAPAPHVDATGVSPVRHYLRKLAGDGHHTLPRVPLAEIVWSWVGAVAGIGVIHAASRLVLVGIDRGLVIGSMGATAVLVYGAPRSPFAQPRAVIGGHMVSALVGVACQQLLPDAPELAATLAVSTAIAAMHLTRTLHPPGGATALIAVIGSGQLKALGFGYALAPAGLGAAALVAVAVVVNNLASTRKYPEAWW